eukprot:365663-Chlamydomonas_euryale.AAC.12
MAKYQAAVRQICPVSRVWRNATLLSEQPMQQSPLTRIESPAEVGPLGVIHLSSVWNSLRVGCVGDKDWPIC